MGKWRIAGAATLTLLESFPLESALASDRLSMRIQLAPPRAVLFDVGDTVLEERRFDLEAGIGAVVEERDRAKLLAEEFRVATVEWHSRNEEMLLAQWLVDQVPSLASETIADVENQIWDAVVTLMPMPDVERAFARLSDDGVAIAAISNAAFSGRILRSQLSRYGLADQLRFVVSSADIGSRKPGVAIFQTALERLGVAAQQTWFVGDTVDEDVEGALAAGLQPILFSDQTKPRAFDLPVPVVRSWMEFMRLYESARVSAHEC